MLNDLLFFFSEAFNGMRRSSLMIFISVATITVSLIVFGMFLLLSTNVGNLTDVLTQRLEIRVYLHEGITKRDRLTFQERIHRMNKVKNVEYIPRDEAWNAFRKRYPNLGLSEHIDDNPLPDSFRVFLTDHTQLIPLADYLSGFNDYVTDVVYGGKMAEYIQLLADVSHYGGMVLVGLLTLATLLIVMNTIRLTVLARQKEIEIMQLVGATDQFIRGPFIIEGFIIGFVGGAISVAILKPTYDYFVHVLHRLLPTFPLVENTVMLSKIYIVLFAMGIFLGVMGAFFGVSRSLKSNF